MDEKNIAIRPSIRLFNTPIEIGTRCLTILGVNPHLSFDLDRILYYEYLSLHTADIGGPESLHAAVPSRGVQVYARKEIVRIGLNILLSKELATLQSTETGFLYIITPAGKTFLDYFETPYFKGLLDRVKWVSERFNGFSNLEVFTFINSYIEKWGGEFLSSETTTV